MRWDNLLGRSADKIKLPEAHEQATLWATLLNSLIADVRCRFLRWSGLLVSAFLVHRVLRQIKARLRGEQLGRQATIARWDPKFSPTPGGLFSPLALPGPRGFRSLRKAIGSSRSG